MPSPKTSKLGAIMAFFRSAPMELATEGLALARELIQERKNAAEKVRQGQESAARKRAKEEADKKAKAGKQAAPAAQAAKGPKARTRGNGSGARRAPARQAAESHLPADVADAAQPRDEGSAH